LLTNPNGIRLLNETGECLRNSDTMSRFIQKRMMKPMLKTATSQIAWDNQHTHIERYRMYSQDQIAAADKSPKEARIVCHQMKPNKCRAIA